MSGAIRVLHATDDRPLTASSLAHSDRTFVVESVTSAREGRARLAADAYECVVVDPELSDGSGLEFLRTVSDDYPSLPTFLLSTHHSTELVREAIDAGVTDWLPREPDRTTFPLLADRIADAVARQRARNRTRDLERRTPRLQVLFEQAPDGIVVHDAAGTVLDVNEALVDMLGYTRAELLSMTITEFEVGIDEDELEDIWTSMATGTTHRVELEGTHRRSDGSTYPVEVWVSRVRTDAGDDRFVAFARDITARKQRIHQLRVLDRVLRHNLHNEMTIIRGSAEQIEDQASDTAATYARDIITSCDHLLETATKERDIVRILSERPHRTDVDLVGVLERAVESVRDRCPDAEITLQGPDQAWVTATTTIDEAIVELLENAVVHNDRETPTITADVTRENGSVRVRIADDGPGIPEAETRVLADGQEIDPLYHGSGLGLWLVYWIVERSDGGIRFESNEPRGSVIELTLASPDPASSV